VPARPAVGIKAAAAYGLKFEVEKDGDQMHGVVTHVINQAGQMRARFHGLKFDPTDLILFVNAPTNEPPGQSSGTRISAGAAGVGAPLWFDVLMAAVSLAAAVPAVLFIRRLGRR
jgi:hypothetical protein